MIRTVTCAAKPPPKTYHEIKSTLKRDTLACGIGLSAFHSTLNGAGGASSIVGTWRASRMSICSDGMSTESRIDHLRNSY